MRIGSGTATVMMMVGKQGGVKSTGIDVSDALETRLMSLFKQKVVSSSGSIVLIGKQAFSSIFSIVSQTHCLAQNVVVDRNGVLPHQNALNWWMTVQSVKFMRSYGRQSQSLIASCKQPLEDVSREGRNVMRYFVV